MKRIALIGECMIELNGELFGDMVQKYGGDSLNTALYMSRASRGDVHIDYMTAMGEDAVSKGMISKWKEEGINTECVMIDKERNPGLYLIQLDKQGERSFLYWRNNSAARYMVQHPSFPHIIEQLHSYDMVYVSGISLAILPEADRCHLIKSLLVLSRSGVNIVFDSNYRPNLWGSEEFARASYELMYAASDMALVTDEDEFMLWNESSVDQSVARLKNSGLKELVIKRGAEGCEYHNLVTGESEFIPARKVDTVIDTTSAGDAFNAGYMLGMLHGREPFQCALQGHELASTVIQYKGAIIPREVNLPIFKEAF